MTTLTDAVTKATQTLEERASIAREILADISYLNKQQEEREAADAAWEQEKKDRKFYRHEEVK